MSPTAPTRRHDLDVLRVFACYLLLLFHTAMVFNPAPFYHVRNDEQAFFFLVLCGFIGLWHMPLLFLLAGWSAESSLRSRGVLGFLRERRAKLVVPLLVGCVLLAPGIKYLELRSGLDLNHRGLRVAEELQPGFRTVIPSGLPLAPPFDEGFLEFLPSFFTDVDRFSWSHLWFLAYLIAITLVLLPVMSGLLRARGRETEPARLAVYLPIAPLAAIQWTLAERFPGPYNLYEDWAHLAFFTTFFLCGFLLALRPGFEAGIRAEWRRALAVALATTGLLLAAVLGAVEGSGVLLLGSAVAGWCFVAALLGFARERFTRGGPRLRYLADSAFPVYLLHQPVIVFLGFGVVQLPLGIAAKFVLLLVGSTATTLALYQVAVRPFGAARWLTGGVRRSDAGGPLDPLRGAAAGQPARS
jgi:peptidoglycan/LPS O-acetylase OafA/YrhL